MYNNIYIYICTVYMYVVYIDIYLKLHMIYSALIFQKREIMYQICNTSLYPVDVVTCPRELKSSNRSIWKANGSCSNIYL